MAVIIDGNLAISSSFIGSVLSPHFHNNDESLPVSLRAMSGVFSYRAEIQPRISDTRISD